MPTSLLSEARIEQVRLLRLAVADGMTAEEIARAFSVSRATAYRWLRDIDRKGRELITESCRS